jgi:hypothetical protein
MWDDRVVERVEEAVGTFSISCKFRNVSSGFEWAFSGVYGPNRNAERRLFWEELSGICSWWDVPWCVGGDFNTVRFPSERVGSDQTSPAMRDFSDFISSLGLLDIPMEGGSMTWSNFMSRSRLDRFLFSPSLEDHFSKIIQRRLPLLLSDHFPVLLICGYLQKRKSPFRFENMWLKEAGFHDKVKQWWESYIFAGSSSFILAQKLKALKVDLRKWNVEVFGDVNVRKNTLLTSIQHLDGLEEEGQLSVEDKMARDHLKSDFEHVLLMDEITWRQKSRALWLREGDHNTRFFHRIANSNRRFNTISRLLLDGVVTSDQTEIGDGLVNLIFFV